MMRPDHHNPNALDNMTSWKRYCFHKFTMSSCYGKDVAEMQSLEIDDMLRIRLREAGTNEEIFTSVAWIRAFNINEPIYAELCHEFYLTCEFDKVCGDDELQTKKIIKFILGGRAHSLTLLEFTRRLGLYQAVELDEEGHQNRYEKVAGLIARWMEKEGARTEKETLILLWIFILNRLLGCAGFFLLTEDRAGVGTKICVFVDLRANMHDWLGLLCSHCWELNPPSYAQPQYDQYYQQYPPPPPQYPPQYQQQQHDDDE
ncbi:hypothetical protein Tco_0942020 [Tanacetum coccineum]|uniref:Uncharacterized protein n=1 Tax=Tanacetum coccineum TaxID=301880 RepID=A0ABQ5DSH9_9ASTR